MPDLDGALEVDVVVARRRATGAVCAQLRTHTHSTKVTLGKKKKKKQRKDINRARKQEDRPYQEPQFTELICHSPTSKEPLVFSFIA